jgi:FAD/FMN-containing dehydrogenase
LHAEFRADTDSSGVVPNKGLTTLQNLLTHEVTGEVLFDRFNRGRYATDASFYQIIPVGVIIPRSVDEALRTLAICRDHGRIVTPRGGGTSQCGQTVNDGIIIDLSKHLTRILSLDVDNRTCVVEPGIVLDHLNRQLKPHGLWFPVDVSTASRATIGGMAGNNSCGGRSLRYGTMRDNTLSMDAALADGTLLRFGEVPRDRNGKPSGVLLAWPRRLALFAKGLESLLGIFRHRQ